MALNVLSKCLNDFYVNQCHHRLLFSNSTSLRTLQNCALFIVNKRSLRINTNVYSDDVPLGVDSKAVKKPMRKKTVEIPKILLCDEKKNQMQITVEQAKKIAKSKGLQLIKEKDATSNQKAVYRLAKLSEIIADNPEVKVPIKKHQKMLALSSKITDHDLEIKIKNMKKILAKDNIVRVTISKEGGETSVQNIIKKIESGVKEVGVISKKVSASNPNFVINPIIGKPESEDTECGN